MLIIHHTLHNNRKKVLIVQHTLENRPKNEILSYTRTKITARLLFFFRSGTFATQLQPRFAWRTLAVQADARLFEQAQTSRYYGSR